MKTIQEWNDELAKQAKQESTLALRLWCLALFIPTSIYLSGVMGNVFLDELQRRKEDSK